MGSKRAGRYFLDQRELLYDTKRDLARSLGSESLTALGERRHRVPETAGHQIHGILGMMSTSTSHHGTAQHSTSRRLTTKLRPDDDAAPRYSPIPIHLPCPGALSLPAARTSQPRCFDSRGRPFIEPRVSHALGLGTLKDRRRGKERKLLRRWVLYLCGAEERGRLRRWGDGCCRTRRMWRWRWDGGVGKDRRCAAMMCDCDGDDADNEGDRFTCMFHKPAMLRLSDSLRRVKISRASCRQMITPSDGICCVQGQAQWPPITGLRHALK